MGPYNKAHAAFIKEANRSSPSFSRLKVRSKKAADTLSAFVRGVQATPWPADVQPLADDVAADAAKLIAPYRAMAKAKTVAEFNAVEIPDTDAGAAQLLRAKLGLPEVPVS